VDDTNFRVPAGEVLEEPLGEVETEAGAAQALHAINPYYNSKGLKEMYPVNASSVSRRFVDCDRHLLATAVGSITKLLSMNG
jgi:hypothetical protein